MLSFKFVSKRLIVQLTIVPLEVLLLGGFFFLRSIFGKITEVFL